MARSNMVIRRFNSGTDSFDVFKCETDGAEFSRPTMRGVKPLHCPEHTTVAVKATPVNVPTVANVAVVNPMPAKARHYRYSLIKAIVGAGVNVYLVGPAGSGKSTVADQIAEDMGLPSYSESGHELMTAYDLLGFKNAMGEFILTYLCEAMENGGIFLMDELDAMNSAALVAMNRVAALKPGDRIRIGSREIRMHADFHLIAGGNTWGRGPDGVYISRQQLDGAVLDRYAAIEFGYDAHLEFLACGVPVPGDIPANPRFKRGTAVTDATDWVRTVQRYRIAFKAANVKDVLVTPRASIMGSRMLAAGIHPDYVVETVIKRGLDATEWRTVKGCLPVPVAA